MMNTIHVAILEDHPLMIKGYESSLSTAPHITVVKTARFGEDLLPMLAQHAVDLLLLDVQVPTSEENRSVYPILAVIPKIMERYQSLQVLVSSMHNDRGLIQAFMENGASGYILKDDLKAMRDLETIITSIVYDDEIYLSEGAQFQVDKQRGKKTGATQLTTGQLKALSLCGAYPDKSITQLAKQLNVANSTVRNTLSTSYMRLGVRSRNAAVEKARRLGLIDSNTMSPIISELQRQPDAEKETASH
ncbi:MAG: response regulator transcription factor [Chloroflexi bacterium]|nr:response regulator transcription factor [Chloroflexota bacterium]